MNVIWFYVRKRNDRHIIYCQKNIEIKLYTYFVDIEKILDKVSYVIE